jgi:hypothetical protein
MAAEQKNANRGVHVVFICAILQPALKKEMDLKNRFSNQHAGEARP